MKKASSCLGHIGDDEMLPSYVGIVIQPFFLCTKRFGVILFMVQKSGVHRLRCIKLCK